MLARGLSASTVHQVYRVDLRHCHAIYLAESGVPVHIVARQLGHRSTTVTIRYYVHPVRDARQAVDALATRLLELEPDPAGSRP